ncbi:MAG: hypothetical protein ACFBZ8_04305 [Opitutales bacterium]
MKPIDIIHEERGLFVVSESDYGREDAHSECEHCGVIGAGKFGGRMLCNDCIEGMGSCCPEFGKDDLWAENAIYSGARY